MPAVLLFFLAPLFGEYLLGNLRISEIVYLPFIAPLYGAGALLIREVTRRAGRGTATMLILGIAYGLIEEGLVDQMLFNSSYAGQERINDTYIAVLGVDAWLTLLVLTMHTVWSTYIPITLVESLFPEQGTRPWLRLGWLGMIAMIFILGSIYLCYTIYLDENFFASAPQLWGTAIAVIMLLIIAFTIQRPIGAPVADSTPDPWILGIFSLTAGSLFMLADTLPGWVKVGAGLLIAIVFFTAVFVWSRRIGWSAIHRLALIGGGILTYGWLGLFMEPESGPKTVFDYMGSIILASGAIALLAIAAGKLQKFKIIPLKE